MLYLSDKLRAALHAQAQAALPAECCGVLVGKNDSAQRLIAMRNCASGNDAFAFDSGEQLALWRALRASGEQLLAIYHSHPTSAAYPSSSDIAYAMQPELHYLIIAANQKHGPCLRSFRIVQGQVTEEAILPAPASP